MNLGSVSVDDAGVVTGSGMCLAYYKALVSVEEAEWPDPEVPSEDFTGTADSWRERVNTALVNVKKGIARQAMAMALGGAGLSPETSVGHRLTLASGSPINTSELSSGATLYLTAHHHNRIMLFDGAGWVCKATDEVSLSLAGVTANVNYDIFGYVDTNGAVALELGPGWSGANTRFTALVRQDGIWVKGGNPTRRHLGTIRGSAAGNTQDREGFRFVWNRYNRIRQRLRRIETTASWTYASSTMRIANATAANAVEFVTGDLVETYLHVGAFVEASAISWGCPVGIGFNNTTNVAQRFGSLTNNGASVSTAEWRGFPSVGYHKVNWLEKSGGTTLTWYSMPTDSSWGASGILGHIEC